MIAKLLYQIHSLRSTFWFVPAVICVAAVGLATGLVTIDANVELHAENAWPLLFGAGAAGSRGLLTAISSSMITVAGVVFSITLVALSLTSSQYTSRVLRNFMRDRMNQAVLGVFVGIFAYCLVVLRTIRGGDEGAFVPSLAVLVGLVLAFVGIGFLIFFIHHISIAIQASSIIAEAADETGETVDHLYPELLGDSTDEDPSVHLADDFGNQKWSVVVAKKSGYVESVDMDALLSFASKNGTILRVKRGIGEFVVRDTPLLLVAGSDPPDDKETHKLNDAFVIGRQRTVQQDVGFGIRQIVDIAMRALSTGINDTTTAVMCVDYLSAILARLASRKVVPPHGIDEGELLVIARGPSFESLLGLSFDQIRQNADGNIAVMVRQLQSLDEIGSQTTNSSRRQLLRHQAELIADVAKRTILSPDDYAVVDAALKRLA